MRITYFNEKQNVLYINTNLITKRGRTINETLKYFDKPYSERINESQYKEQINEELKKHPGCKISEFMDL